MFGDVEENPNLYRICKLSEMSKFKLSYGSNTASKDFDGNIRYIRITDILENGELSEDKKSPTKFEEKFLLREGDLLFARSGATVGKTYFHYNNKDKSIYAGYLIRLIPNKEMVYPEYVYAYTKTRYYEKLIQEVQRTVAQPNINAKEYGNFKILCPPIEKQFEYVSFLKQLDKSKFRMKKCLRILGFIRHL